MSTSAQVQSKETRPTQATMVSLVKNVDPVSIIGVILAAAIAFVLLVAHISNAAESFIIGLVGINTSLIIDSIARGERRFALSRTLSSVEWLSSVFAAIAESTKTAVNRFPETEVSSEVRSLYDQLSADLNELEDGRIRRPRGDYEHLIAGAEGCNKDLKGLTNVHPGTPGEPGWWDTEVGRHYWRANEAALRRGVRITRIFIYSEMTDSLAAVVGAQREAGVDVGLVKHRHLDASLHLNFAIWDDKKAWEARMNAQGEIVENLFSLNKNDIERLIRAFRRCNMIKE